MYKRMIVVALAATLLSGCAATQVAISKRDLDVQTKMSETVFLDPVGADKKTILGQSRNTSDKPDLSVNDEIAAALQAKGYTLMQDPDVKRSKGIYTYVLTGEEKYLNIRQFDERETGGAMRNLCH